MEQISGGNFYEDTSAIDGPVGRHAGAPSQSEVGADGKHNWQGGSDERIKLAVMTALHWDLAVPRDRVKVSVDRGWVTLTGQVLRVYEKACAEADAQMTPGVAGVTNQIGCLSGD
jgi:osmotically-inducible protein OsmY